MTSRSLADCSGPWTGFWILELTRGQMKLRLDFAAGNINGGGNDPIGAFTVTGIYSPETERVLFSSQYKTHSVEYIGLWDGNMIYGKWTLSDTIFTETGDFEIWPDREQSDVLFSTQSSSSTAEE